MPAFILRISISTISNLVKAIAYGGIFFNQIWKIISGVKMNGIDTANINK